MIWAESLGSLSSWSTSAVRTSCPVTRATPSRSAASRCQMSRARCWPGERSTVRRVFGLRVRPMAKESVGAAATEGVSGVTAAWWARDRSASALPRLLSEPICDLLAREPDVSMSVDQFQYIRTSGPFDSDRTAGKRITLCRWAPRAQSDDKKSSTSRFGPPTGMTRIRRWASILVATMPRSRKRYGVPECPQSFRSIIGP